ncbi:MAG TPA: hypothetical protein VJA23_03100 [Candidatus Nanoarchaeia archaeon]|nr:hypothetical protein [Candidatus Nanoarchaeia archaeon]
MECVQAIKMEDCIRKINRVEQMLEEIKSSLTLFDKEMHLSIERGEKDIAEGRFTVCKTEEDLDAFFASV